jgi:hypothetical protein
VSRCDLDRDSLARAREADKKVEQLVAQIKALFDAREISDAEREILGA